MEKITCILERIKYQSEYGSFSVCVFDNEEELIIGVGAISMINPGESVELFGQFSIHPKFGKRFMVKNFNFIDPSSLEMIKKFLSSGFVKGIGPVTADKIVSTFKEKTFEIMDKSPRSLLKVEGIGKSKLETIKTNWDTQRSIRTIMVFLQKHGLSIKMATKIYGHYDMKAIDIITENPYRLIQDIRGIGFATADTIAMKQGIDPDDPNRLSAILLYILERGKTQGHTAMDEEKMRKEFSRLCEEISFPRHILENLEKEERIVKINWNEKEYFAESSLNEVEESLSHRINEILNEKFSLKCNYVDSIMHKATGNATDLTDEQREACKLLFSEKIMILTGGPGTGKTTTLRTIIKAQKMIGAKILLCAPTGRAAYQMKEATDMEASTIHRLIKLSGKGEAEHDSFNPLNCHVLIVDEVSMIDTKLMFHLLEAVPTNAKILFVGDRNQIPSVGPGNILADLIASKKIRTINLTKIFRQSGRSAIVTASHDILNGRIPKTPKGEELSEFYFVNIEDSAKARNMMLRLLKDRIPKRFNFDPMVDVQILSPMYKGECGVDKMNFTCQESLNVNSRHLMHRGNCFKLGDRVINLENNYDKMIFNGDCGIITGIDPIKKNISIKFSDRTIVFEYDELDNLKLSYAITIHKSQGSEYSVVIIPALFEHYLMLRRNLLYTAVSRGRNLVIVVGSKKALHYAVNNSKESKRITLLQKYMEKLEIN